MHAHTALAAARDLALIVAVPVPSRLAPPMQGPPHRSQQHFRQRPSGHQHAPLHAKPAPDDRGVIALEARVKVLPAHSAGAQRLAIRPYPAELEERVDFDGLAGVLLRPIRPEDEPLLRAFLADAAPNDLRFRFFIARRELARSELARFSQIDYDREMAFIAVAPQAHQDKGGAETGMLGEVRVATDPDNLRAEFAIMLRSDLKGRGLGTLLLAKMVRYLKSRGTRVLAGECLRQNTGMTQLARGLGFRLTPSDDGETMLFALDLQPVK